MDYNDTSPFVKDWVQDIIDYANDKGYAILLGIDSNCHSTLYGLETNRRGEELQFKLVRRRKQSHLDCLPFVRGFLTTSKQCLFID